MQPTVTYNHQFKDVGKTIKVYDDLIDESLHQAVYDWGQSVSWYAKALLDQDGQYIKGGAPNDRDFGGWPVQEYRPSLHGNANPRPDTPQGYESELVSLWRHTISWDDISLQERNPIVWSLFDKINNLLFDGQATTDGLPEGHVLTGPREYYVDGQDFYEKYDSPVTDPRDPNSTSNSIWTTMLNARNTMPGHKFYQQKIGDRMGQLHKDSEGGKDYDSKYLSVLFISNMKWDPMWGGELKYYGDEETGATQWKHGYNIGYPVACVGHKPGRIITYSHDQAHLTESPRVDSDEFAQKIAFRVKLPD